MSLRWLAAPKKKFSLTVEDEREFEALKAYLLDSSIGVIRVCSQRIEDGILCFTDSLGSTFFCIVTQSMYPLPGSNLDLTKKYLHIIGCHSRAFTATESLFAIWVNELLALEEMCRKSTHFDEP